MFLASLQASSRWMMDESTVLQQLETITDAVSLFLLHQQLCGLFPLEAMNRTASSWLIFKIKTLDQKQ